MQSHFLLSLTKKKPNDANLSFTLPKEERLDENSEGTMQDDMSLPAKSINSAQTNLQSKRA